MKTQPTAEHLRQAFEYLRATVLRGPPWPARLEDLPRESSRYVAVQAVARAMARRGATPSPAPCPTPHPVAQPFLPLLPPLRHDAKRAAANDRDEDDDAP